MRTTTPIEPLRLGALGQRWAVIVDGAVSAAYALPEGVRRAVALYNATHRDHAEADRAYLDRFPARWLDRAPDARGRAVVRALLTATGTVEMPADLIAPIEESEAIAHRLDLRRQTLQAAADESERLLDSIMSEGTILPCLRDALHELLEAVRRLPGDAPMTAEAALDAPQGQREAYRQMQGLLGRYQAIRAAQDALRARYPSKDTGGLFLTSPVEPRTDRIASLGARPERAGPPDGVGRLLWLAEPGHAWLPTADEQSTAYDGWLVTVSDTLAVKTFTPPARHVTIHPV